MKPELIRLGAVLAAGLIIITGFWFVSKTQDPCPKGCNVILVMVDTLSGNHLKTYGYMRDTMPETTAFFEKNGVIFDTASSNSTWTMPSFTGMYFSDIASNITYKELSDRSRPTLLSELHSHNVTVRAVRPAGETFIYDAITRLYEKDEVTPGDSTHRPTETGTERIKELSQTEDPFFLLVHTFEAHEPYMPEAPYNEYFSTLEGYSEVTAMDLMAINGHQAPGDPETIDAYRLRYDQQIAQTDHHVSEMLKAISTSTLAHTVVILSADHGESFFEHGSVRHGNNGVYQEEVHIPLMMRIPGMSSRRIEEPVSLLDMSPTILSFMNIPVPETFKGKSLVPLIQGHSLGERVIPFVTGIPPYLNLSTPIPRTLEIAGAKDTQPIIPLYALGVRIGKEKLFKFIDDPQHTGWHWYDLAKDPEEQNNLATGTTPLPEKLKNAIDVLRSQAK